MKKQLFTAYQTPVAEVISIDGADILTLSSGFDGEEHEFPIPLN